jgi:transcriptional antiterminator NusG
MAKSWYTINTYTSYEKKIERTINLLLKTGELDSSIVTDVKLPTQDVKIVKDDGKTTTRSELVMPGYLLLEMDLPELGWKDTCNKIRHIQGVSGFVGTKPNERPRPISNAEVKKILEVSGEIKGTAVTRVKTSYLVGDSVKIIDGPFASFTGKIEEIFADKEKLRVNVQIFGRATPVELDFKQVTSDNSAN